MLVLITKLTALLNHWFAAPIFALLTKLGISFKTFHSTRHAFATRMKLAGKTLEQIGKLIGHSDVKTTGIYVHE